MPESPSPPTAQHPSGTPAEESSDTSSKPEPDQPTEGHAGPKATAPDADVAPGPDSSDRPKAQPVPDAQPQPEDVRALAAALRAARAALESHHFDEAQAKLAQVESVPKRSEHRAKFERLKLLVHYAKEFRSALLESVATLRAGSEIQIATGERIAVVSASPERITIKARGTTRTYAIDDLPAGLAIAIADHWLDQENPVSLVIKAAYLASLKDRRDDRLAKAREWFQQAAAKGMEIGDLARVIDDAYDDLEKGIASQPSD